MTAVETLSAAEIADYEQDVLKAAEENHIWINAFTLVRPTARQLLDVEPTP